MSSPMTELLPQTRAGLFQPPVHSGGQRHPVAGVDQVVTDQGIDKSTQVLFRRSSFRPAKIMLEAQFLESIQSARWNASAHRYAEACVPSAPVRRAWDAAASCNRVGFIVSAIEKKDVWQIGESDWRMPKQAH